MCSAVEWLAKYKYIAPVTIPVHPGAYTRTIHVTKFRYKEALGLHAEYKGHMQNSVKEFSTCFTECLLIDLETDGQMQ